MGIHEWEYMNFEKERGNISKSKVELLSDQSNKTIRVKSIRVIESKLYGSYMYINSTCTQCNNSKKSWILIW